MPVCKSVKRDLIRSQKRPTIIGIPEHNVGRLAKQGALEPLEASWHELNDEFVGSGFTFSLLGVAGAGTRRPARFRVRGAGAFDTSVSDGV